MELVVKGTVPRKKKYNKVNILGIDYTNVKCLTIFTIVGHRYF